MEMEYKFRLINYPVEMSYVKGACGVKRKDGKSNESI